VGTGQGIHSPTETERKQNLQVKTRSREKTETAPLGSVSGILRVANRHPVEGAAQGNMGRSAAYVSISANGRKRVFQTDVTGGPLTYDELRWIG
jgi:hypothetical protein